MKKTSKVLAFALALAVSTAFIPADVHAAGARDAVTAAVIVTAGSNSGFDLVNRSITASSDMVETYYSGDADIVNAETAGAVTFADAMVAAHIAKYGAAFKADPASYLGLSYNKTYKSVSVTKQFGHTMTGIYYKNDAATGAVNSTAVASGDRLYIGSFNDTYNDLYSRFDRNSYSAYAGRAINVKITADNWGTAVSPSSATVKLLNAGTGTLGTALANAGKNGVAAVKFNAPGTYYISASGDVTYEGWSGQATGKIMAPVAKVGVRLAAPAKIGARSAGWTRIAVSWSKVAGAEKYQIYRAIQGGRYAKVMTTSGVNWTDTKVVSGKRYAYKVRAITGRNVSPFVKVSALTTAPAPYLTLKPGRNSIKLTWTRVSGATGYKIYRADKKTGPYKLLTVRRGEYRQEYTSIRLTRGKTYFYKIRAYKTIGGRNVDGILSPIKSGTAR